MNLRNISWAMGLVLLGSVAMPSLARKKVQPVQKPAVQEDHLSPNDRQRYNYFFLEGARQQAAGNYSAAFDLFEHARKIDPKAAETYFYESLFYSQLKQDSLALAYMQKAIELNPENQTYAEQLGRYYIGSQKYDLAIDAYMGLSPTMKLFGTAINYGFGDVEETGILIAVDEILEEKRACYINTFIAERPEALKITSGANNVIYKEKDI